jgi:NADPH:quinone reductase-like Zn-dependent oxidoreductase
MRAIIYTGKGSSDVMRPAERPVPEPGPGQVRVRMVRAGVNPTDWKERARVSSPMTFPEVTPSLNLRYQFLLLYTLDPDLLAAAARDVTAAVAAGALRAGEQAGLPLHRYPLAETAAAHDAVERGAVGKVLIDIG